MQRTENGRGLLAVGLIVLGLLFLGEQFFDFNVFGFLWPFLVMLPGIAFLYAALNGDRNAAGMAVPGAIITGTGLILFMQNVTGRWESWAYVWTLYPVFLGLALQFIGRRTESAKTLADGRGFVKWGGIAFVGAMVFFELMIFNDGGLLGDMAFPLVLIAIGAFMLFSRPRAHVDYGEKRKVVRTPAYAGNGKHGGQTLRQKIDAALAEDDEQPTA